MAGPITRLRRYLWGRKPLPGQWEAILQRRLWFYRAYPPDVAATFRRYLQVFAREKYFMGAGDWRVDDEKRVAKAGDRHSASPELHRPSSRKRCRPRASPARLAVTMPAMTRSTRGPSCRRSSTVMDSTPSR